VESDGGSEGEKRVFGRSNVIMYSRDSEERRAKIYRERSKG
jgi:hypothetical protein